MKSLPRSIIFIAMGAAIISMLGLFWGITDLKQEQFDLILFDIRIPRLLTVLMTGGILALLGLIFQALFQNSLASPYTSGVSAAAAFGAGLATYSNISISILGISSVTVGALLATIFALVMILTILKLMPEINSSALVLCGLICNYFFSSLLLMIQYLSDPGQLYGLTRWLLGNIVYYGYSQAIILAVIGATSLLYFYRSREQLDLMSLGDEIALSRGVDVNKLRKKLLILTSVITAILVAMVGPIGFVGIIIPHITRIYFGFSHGRNVMASFILGALFLSLCDVLAYSVLAQTELPIGLITTLIGAPVFIVLLIRNKTYKFF